MRQTLFSIKRNLKNKVKVFLPVLFLALFLFPVSTNAQISTPPKNFDDFLCLFEKKGTPVSRCKNPQNLDSDIDKGLVSGAIYKQPNEVTSTGIKSVQIKISLFMDKMKIDGVEDGASRRAQEYFFNRIADDRNDSFFIRIGIDSPIVENQKHYEFFKIGYKGGARQLRTNTGDLLDFTYDYTVGLVSNGLLDPNFEPTPSQISFFRPSTNGYNLITNLTRTLAVRSKNIEELPFGSKIYYDFWYCGGKSAGEDVDGRDPLRDGDRIEYFTTDGKYKDYTGEKSDAPKYIAEMCGGTAAYKIGDTKEETLPETFALASEAASKPVDADVNASTYAGSVMPTCHILNGWGPGSGSFMACISNTFYYLVFKPIAWFAWLMGQIFDFFIGYSLSDESYRHNFVQTGWQLVRDISNIFFIIIMIYSGLAAVFKTSNVSYKKVIPTLIINALIINFSLFATRIVIDMSNITARIFYNQMVVCPKDDPDCSGATGAGGFKSISSSIVSSFNPQRIMQNANFLNSPSTTDLDPDKDDDDGSTVQGSTTTNQNGDFNTDQSSNNGSAAGLSRSSTEYAAYFGLVALIMSMIAFGTAMMFWKTAFMFLGRVIGLYVAMIFSPFAFLSRGGVPLVSNIPTLNYGSWWKDLTNYALLAPIFVFFLYIINAFLKADFIDSLGLNQNTSNFFEAVIYVVIPMLIIYGLISQGVGIAKTLAGRYGDMVQGFATKATGLVGGAALGVTALGGSRIIGGAAKRLDESRVGVGVRNMAARSGLQGMIGKRLQKGITSTRNASFDARKTVVGSQLSTNMGLNLDQKPINALSGWGLGLGTDQRKGGFDADVKRRQEDQEKKQKLLEEKMSDDQIKAYNEKQQNKRADRIEKLIEKAMIATHGKDNVSDWKKNNKQRYDTEKNNALQDPQLQTQVSNIPPAKEMRSVAEMNKDRRKQYADNLKKSGLDGILGGVPVLGKIIGTTIGAALGANTRKTADKKAAKKIEESSKVEKELADIETTLKKGFQDLIALDLFQNSPSFTTNITNQEQQDIVKFGTIQNGTNKGKGMYDILTDTEKKKVDSEVKQKKDAMSQGTDDEKKKAKEEYEEYEDLIKARESNKFDLKDLRAKLKTAKENWVNNPADQSMRDLFREKLKEVKIAEKHQDKWRDLNNYIKTRRDKLKGEDKK